MHAKECGNFGNRVGTGLVGFLYRRVAEFVPASDRLQRCCRPVFTHDFRAQRLAIDMIENALHECLAAKNPGAKTRRAAEGNIMRMISIQKTFPRERFCVEATEEPGTRWSK